MTIQILHTSDLHGDYKKLLTALEGDFDVWVDTGDFFPNKTRGEVAVEVPYQTKWFGWKGLGERVVEALAGRPMVSVAGNHDYANLSALLRDAGGIAFDINEGAVHINGEVFSGFGEVPWIQGEWSGETHGPDFGPIVEGCMSSDPTILVTHAPAAGLLDDKAHGGGVVQLTSALTWQPHKVKAHFFGHIHDTQGSVVEMGIHFINGAGKAIVHTLPSVKGG